MATQISFEIITPEGLKFQAEVWQVQIPTLEGEIGILAHHVPLMTIVTPGVITIRRHPGDREEQIEYIATAGGFMDIDGKRARLLADSAEHATQIDGEQAQAALARAQALRHAAPDQVSFAHAVAEIEQNMARLKAVKKQGRSHQAISPETTL